MHYLFFCLFFFSIAQYKMCMRSRVSCILLMMMIWQYPMSSFIERTQFYSFEHMIFWLKKFRSIRSFRFGSLRIVIMKWSWIIVLLLHIIYLMGFSNFSDKCVRLNLYAQTWAYMLNLNSLVISTTHQQLHNRSSFSSTYPLSNMFGLSFCY